MAEYSLETGAQIAFYRPTSAQITVLPQGVPIAGIDGEDGEDGRTVLHGTDPPAGGVGSDGDFFIDVSHWRIYLKTAGDWGTGQSIIGPEGSSIQGGIHAYMFGGM